MSLDLWTLLLQTANVLVLVWLLQRYLFRPVADAVAKRQTLVTARLDEARQARDKAEALKTALESEKASQADAREKVLVEARAAAKSERDSILAKAEGEAQARLAGLEAQLAEERRQVKASLEADAAELAIDIARRLLDRFPREALSALFLEDICRTVSGLPEDQLRIVHEDVATGVCRVVAAGLNEDLKGKCHQHLTQALGVPVQVEFVEQPSLIAGVELQFRRLVIRSNWSRDLEQLRARLTDHERIQSPV